MKKEINKILDSKFFKILFGIFCVWLFIIALPIYFFRKLINFNDIMYLQWLNTIDSLFVKVFIIFGIYGIIVSIISFFCTEIIVINIKNRSILIGLFLISSLLVFGYWIRFAIGFKQNITSFFLVK